MISSTDKPPDRTAIRRRVMGFLLFMSISFPIFTAIVVYQTIIGHMIEPYFGMAWNYVLILFLATSAAAFIFAALKWGNKSKSGGFPESEGERTGRGRAGGPVGESKAGPAGDAEKVEAIQHLSEPCAECGRKMRHYNVDDAGLWEGRHGVGDAKRFSMCLCGSTTDMNLLTTDMEGTITHIIPADMLDPCQVCGVGRHVWGEVRPGKKGRLEAFEFTRIGEGPSERVCEILFLCKRCLEKHHIRKGQNIEYLLFEYGLIEKIRAERESSQAA